MPRWRRDATEFVVGVNHNSTGSYLTRIPMPIMKAWGKPKRMVFRVADDGTVFVEPVKDEEG